MFQVAYDRVDVAMSYLGIKAARYSVIDYTMPTQIEASSWVSKAPGKADPFWNIIKTFDTFSWIFTLAR